MAANISQTERLNDLDAALGVALDGLRSNMWHAMPGIVQSYNAAQNTVQVQLSVKDFDADRLGLKGFVAIAPLLDVPVVFPRGGGLVLTFPVSPGDECLVVFANRCIDNWWLLGGVQAPAEVRPNEISDGFAVMGVFSVPNVPPAIASDSAQLRTQTGDTFVEVTRAGVVNIVSTGPTNVTAPQVAIGADGQALYSLINDTFIALFNDHQHGSSGPPNTLATASNATTTLTAG